MLVLLLMAKADATSPNLTAVTPLNPVPVIVTVLPIAPLLALALVTSRQPVRQQVKPVSSSENARRLPVSPITSSITVSVHVPFGFSPSKADNGFDGLNVPVYGAPK